MSTLLLKTGSSKPHPNEAWMKQIARNITMDEWGFLESRRYLIHFHTERNHQGKDNVLLFPVAIKAGKRPEGAVNCKERLGGLLKYYHRDAA